MPWRVFYCRGGVNTIHRADFDTEPEADAFRESVKAEGGYAGERAGYVSPSAEVDEMAGRIAQLEALLSAVCTTENQKRTAEA